MIHRNDRTPVLLASTNQHKIKEFKAIFQNFGVCIEGLPPLSIDPPEENGMTFQENADLKAEYYSRFVEHPVLADDSGLCVTALSGEPGIFSARFSGEQATDLSNNQTLLKRMEESSIRSREGKFVCSLSLAERGVVIHRTTGEISGVILEELKGEGGFGYDPLFFVPGSNKTFSEMTPWEKNSVSHRFEACRKMAPFLQ